MYIQGSAQVSVTESDIYSNTAGSVCARLLNFLVISSYAPDKRNFQELIRLVIESR